MGNPENGATEHPGRQAVHDLTASLVNFAIQIATCFAVAVASGFPPTTGFITLIVGAFIVAPLASCRFQVSTCAASMIALTWIVIDQHGVGVFGLVLLTAGLLQVGAALLRWARWFGAVSPSLVFGLMTGIGAIVTISQLLAVLGRSSRGSGLENLAQIGPTLIELATTHRHELGSVGIGFVAATIAAVWPRIEWRPLRAVPGALMALVVATLIAMVADVQVQHAHVSGDLLGHLRILDLETVRANLDWRLLWAALPIAFLASTESLLAATILDRLKAGKKTQLDRELFAQGVGNIACGLVGCLPLEGSASRGVANVEAGARTRWAVILPGVWAILLLSLAPWLLETIPVVGLSGILLCVGLRLIDLKAMAKLREYGLGEVLIYLATVAAMIVVDVSTGILIGFFVCLAKIVFTFSSDLEITVEGERGAGVHVVSLKGAATFLALPKLTELVKGMPTNHRVELSLDRVYHVDYGCAEFLTGWARRLEADGGQLDVDWQRVRGLYTSVHNLLERSGDESRGWLVFHSGPLSGNRFQLMRTTTLGRGADVDILLDDAGVSDQHALIFEADDGRMTLIDMESTSGVWRAEQRVERQVLEPGTRLRIGSSELEFLLDEKQAPAPRR